MFSDDFDLGAHEKLVKKTLRNMENKTTLAKTSHFKHEIVEF